MNEHSKSCDIICDTEYGPGGGYRNFSYASWCWDDILKAFGKASDPDELWDIACADIEGTYFSDGHGEMMITPALSIEVDRISEPYGGLELSYLRLVCDDAIVLELVVEHDSETDAASGISVLCDCLWDAIHG